MDNLPTSDNLQIAWLDIREIHQKFLLKHEVKIPNTDKYSTYSKSIWLSVLHYYFGQYVNKNVISDICKRDYPELAHDQQVRHLKRDGWCLDSDGRGNHKLDPYRCSPEWINEQVRRKGRLAAASFQEMKLIYGNCCATCGAKEGQPDPRYGSETVYLQQAHQDPKKPSKDPENIIPQCQFCNKTYKDDFVFDNKGRVKAVASTKAVRSASETVQRENYEWLKKKFK